MLDRLEDFGTGLWVETPPPLPVADLVLGMTREEAAETVPRIFNLCQSAQSMAIRMALGLPAPETATLIDEICREHVMRLAILLPARLGIDCLTFPLAARAELPGLLFGQDSFPNTPDAFGHFLASGRGIAPVLGRIRDLFEPSEATACLPAFQNGANSGGAALDNSVAARCAGHPVMRHIEHTYGRGPLWRLTARAVDLQAALDGELPLPRLIAPGTAIVPAARGYYSVKARHENGRVTSFERVTPTDHLLAKDGVLARAFASLPHTKHHLAELVIDILDPCVPLQVKGVQNA